MTAEEAGYGICMSGVLPPLAGRLARRGDHRAKQDEQRRVDVLGHERAGEPAEGLRDDDDLTVPRRGARDRHSVIARVRVGVIQRERRSECVVAKTSQLVDRGLIDTRIRTGAWDEDESGHSEQDEATGRSDAAEAPVIVMGPRDHQDDRTLRPTPAIKYCFSSIVVAGLPTAISREDSRVSADVASVRHRIRGNLG